MNLIVYLRLTFISGNQKIVEPFNYNGRHMNQLTEILYMNFLKV